MIRSLTRRRTAKRYRLGLFPRLGLSFCLLHGTAVEVLAQGTPHSTTIVDLGEISAAQAGQGLGIGIGPNGLTQDWQFAAAKAMGASWVRIQCSWNSVEQQQEAPENRPASPRFVQTPACNAALTSAAKQGLHVTETAAFGPPFHQLLYVTLPGGAAPGQTSVQVAYFAGVHGASLANLHPLFDYVCPVFLNDDGLAGKPYRCLSSFSGRASPPGTLVTGVHPLDGTHATLDLASAVVRPVPGNVQSPKACDMAAGSTTLSCPRAAFDGSWDRSVQISVPGAGPRGAALTTYITGVVSPDQLNLRRAATGSVQHVGISANRLYAVGEILYPSTGSDRPDDLSVVAYGDYASFLASDMASHGVTGDIEIWNEPPWRADSWDFRPALYDTANTGPYKPSVPYGVGAVSLANGTLYASLFDHNVGNDPAVSPRAWSRQLPSTAFPGTPMNGANFGFAANLQHRSFPQGVTATWNGTSGNGTASLLGPQMRTYSGEALLQPAKVVTRESLHLYGGPYKNPEEVFMTPDCLRAAARKMANIYQNGMNCYLPGERPGANAMQALYYDFIAKDANPAYGIGHSVTETNNEAPGPGYQLQQARSNVRQFLGLEALGITPIEFFQMWDGGHHDPTFSFVDSDGTSMHPLASYTVFAGLMADLRKIGNPPSDARKGLPLSVARYSGTFPLASVRLTGSRGGTRAASQMLTIWQLSVAPGFTGTITGNTLQVTSMTSGWNTLGAGEVLQGRGIPAGTSIARSVDANGGPGSYTLNHQVSTGSEPMNVDWFTQPSPAPGTVTVSVPGGMRITSALDLVTRKPVPFQAGAAQVTLEVSDDPVELVADPQ